MIRIIGASMVALCGICAAHMLNSDAKRATEQAEALAELLRHVRSEIECFCMPIPKILERCPRELLRRCGYEGDAPSELCELAEGCNISDDACRGVVEDFCREIGKGYRDGTLALCDYYIARFEECRQRLSSSLASKRRKNSTLCVSGALAAVIILI